MLFTISLLTAYLFAVTYPLCLWIHYKSPIKNKFHRFHLGLPNVIGGVVLVVILFSSLPNLIKIYIVIWKFFFLFASRFSWKKEAPNLKLLLLPSLLGYYIYWLLAGELMTMNPAVFVISILASFVFCLSLYTMNLGHFYLNVHGLDITHLKRATLAFWFFVIIRAVWDLFYLIIAKTYYRDEYVSILKFIFTIDGFLLIVAIFFGTLFPLVSNYFAYETLKLKNTQAATGILYVILCAVLLGDLAYKYYLIKYALAL